MLGQIINYYVLKVRNDYIIMTLNNEEFIVLALKDEFE